MNVSSGQPRERPRSQGKPGDIPPEKKESPQKAFEEKRERSMTATSDESRPLGEGSDERQGLFMAADR